MIDDLVERLRDADPAAGANDQRDDERDRDVWVRVTSQPSSRHRERPRPRLIIAGLALAGAAAVVALGLGRGGSAGHDFNAAAETYAALQRPQGIYHFVSVARFARTPRAATEAGVGVIVPFSLPNVHGQEEYSVLGRHQYEEDWVTLDGTRVRWVKFKTRHGLPVALRSAAAFTQPRLRCAGCPGPVAGLSDPATAFRIAYRKGRVHSRGPLRYAGRDAWRLVAYTTGFRQEWIVDRLHWLPLHYRYVQHGRSGSLRYTDSLDVRFLKFEVLPLTEQTRRLLVLSPAERRVEVK